MHRTLNVVGVLVALTVSLPVLGTAHPEAYPVPNPYHVVYAAGHFTTDPVTIFITDDVVVPVGGLVCQDLDGDAICGGAGEPSYVFCGAITLAAFFDYDPLADVHVFVDNVATVLPACGLLQKGVSGTVDHT